jgi:Ca2+/Na+ antiporter
MSLDGTPIDATANIISYNSSGINGISGYFQQILDDGLAPIVVGVTGHRDLRPDDIRSLEAKVKEIYSGLHSSYPNTPIVTLSSLAEGADRLVARVALMQGSSLIVPLPMSANEYEKDFLTEDSTLEFRDLLVQAQLSFIVPNIWDAKQDEFLLDGWARAYLNAGITVARHAHILLALWDGVDSGLTVGTSQIVRLRLDGIPESLAPVRSLLDEVNEGPLYHIVTPRLSDPITEGYPLSISVRYPGAAGDEASAKNQFDNMLKWTEQYNRDISSLLTGQQSVEKNKSYLIPEEYQSQLPMSAINILNAYGAADALAIYFQKKRRNALNGIFILAILAVFIFQIYLDFIERPVILILYPLMLSVAYLWYLHAKRHNYQNKHLDYRALAEGLRVKLFWVLADLDEYVSDHYLCKHSGDIEWIRRAIRMHDLLNGYAGATAMARDNSSSALEMVSRLWFKDQYEYFLKASLHDEERMGKQERSGNRLFWMALVLVFVVFSIDLLFPIVSEHGKHFIELIHPYLILILQMQLAIAAAIGGFSEKMSFAEQFKQYSRMNQLFGRALNRLTSLLRAGDIRSARRLIKELGIESLAENGDWVMLHRSKPLTVPK